MPIQFKSAGFWILFATFALLQWNCKPEKKEGGELRIRFEGAPTVFNPYIPSTGYSTYISNLLFQTLGTVDPQTLLLQPSLVKSIPEMKPVTEGPHAGQLVAEFEINEDAQWDNGMPVTAEDVIFTIKTIFTPQLPTERFRGYFEKLRALEPDSGNNKKFKAYFSEYYILAIESMCQVPIFARYHYDSANRTGSIPLEDFLNPEKKESLIANPDLQAFAKDFQEPKFKSEPSGVSGSGPYKIAAIDGDRSIVLEKKKDWWGDRQVDNFPLLGAFPTRLVYKIVKEEPTIENMLRNRDVDLVSNISASRFLELQKDTAISNYYNFFNQEQTIYNLLILNLRNPALSDVRVRKAMAMAVNYDYLINTVMMGLAKRTVSPVLPTASYYARDIQPYPFDLEKARALLAEAGWSDTNGNGTVDKIIDGVRKECIIKTLIAQSKTTQLTAQSIKETFAQIGIGMEIDEKDISYLSAQTKVGNFDAAILAKSLFPGLVDFYQEYHSNSLAPNGDNRGYFVNPKADSLIELVRTTQNETLRNQYYIEIQKIISDQTPNIFLFSSMSRIIVSKKFEPVLSQNRPGHYEALFQLKPDQR